MRKISDTIARLAALKAQGTAGFGGAGAPDRLAVLSEFGSNPGALKARCHVPIDLPPGAPLVVVLHGCTQSAAEYDHRSGWSRLADSEGFAVLFPEQQRTNNPNLCFNWFVPADVTRDSGEVQSIRSMIRAMVAAHELDERRIFVTGLSAGGAMASSLLATYPETFAGGAIIAGLAHGVAGTVPQAFDRMRGHGLPSDVELQKLLARASRHDGAMPKIAIWQGSADTTVSSANADAIAAQWRAAHGLEASPTQSAVKGRHARETWHGADGEILLEVNIIADMGHGTPLGGDGLGAPGPYMLDVGISSTSEIARFWGIAENANGGVSAELAVAPVEAAPLSEPAMAGPNRSPGQATRERKTAPENGPAGVKKVIEDALRAAGLMR
jgi:poly(hydroxyalkanoate) depolymerase family esterase